LRRFAALRDEQAFAALVRRHGPMVLNVGQRVLHNGHDAEDVFQATFLVFTRKAGSLRWHESVGNWLYQVAYRIARKARAAAARRAVAGVGISGSLSVFIRALPSATFTIPAINPRKPEAYFFEHHKKNLAVAVILKGDEPEGFTLKLKPTATVTGRIVTENGEPVGNMFIHGLVEAGQLNMTRPRGAFFSGRTDADGRFKIEGLLAGVKLGAMSNLFTNVVLKPGEVRDLGDIHLKNSPE